MTTQEFKDPYNWPMPNRKDLMSLKTISNFQPKNFKTKKKIKLKKTKVLPNTKPGKKEIAVLKPKILEVHYLD